VGIGVVTMSEAAPTRLSHRWRSGAGRVGRARRLEGAPLAQRLLEVTVRGDGFWGCLSGLGWGSPTTVKPVKPRGCRVLAMEVQRSGSFRHVLGVGIGREEG